MKKYSIVEMLGDGISAELSASVHAVAAALPFEIEFDAIDISLETRDAQGMKIYGAVMEKMNHHKVAMKYPTATVVESPNKVLREMCDFAVIHRPVMTMPGVENNFKKSIDIDVVRIATGGTYGDRGRRIGAHTAVSLRVIEHGPATLSARFAFKLAMVRKTHVVSASKYTIQAAADGLFEEAVETISHQYPGIGYRRELFDAMLAGIIMFPERYGVIVTPNEYGDFLSDMLCGLIGSIGLGDSSSFAFDEDGDVTLSMFDPAGGTAPDIAGQGICNPAAAILAFGSLVRHLGEFEQGELIRAAVRDAIAAGEKTGDIGGTLGTEAFTTAVIRRMNAAL
jgi:isocitrate dehydrogenase (NAD+)